MDQAASLAADRAPSGAVTAGTDTLSREQAERVFREHDRFVWGLCYRMTGSAADADDLVQETYLRAIERPPPDTSQPWRPWLARVAINLGRDALRRRRRLRYVGPWLPAAIETADQESPPSYEVSGDGQSTEARYDLLESVSLAFLLALEALSPQQRAVLLLRDVFDYSVTETAWALGISEPNVKTTHHRARRAMRAYDRNRCVPTRALQERTQEALARFVTCLTSGDVKQVEALLGDDVCSLSDGGGEFFAARVSVVGRDRVARFHCNIAARRPLGLRLEVRAINGLPALVCEFGDIPRGQPPRVVTSCELGRDGKISRLYSIVATAKLSGIRF